ncbi:hypothetical protein FIV42_00400 [Persicimonas caeni]|uniref:Ava_C0101 and related proteins n=1 Tax=Persicimonas caeni TaxID=2292766 RepID=A0A4Y6PLP7_PERCE|nr:DUF5996 family protein [Persicimonas caeni]QDG49254.1 hypothetical protein FIV42_00400 [Persicimonas caeni]QED30475.1 hypothetical protein FRD00_00395 [Persicimonas caeni]
MSIARAPRTPRADGWPALPYEAWHETAATLHMWTQVIGKIQLAQTPRINHWWNATSQISARGLATSPIPWGNEAFAFEFDFIDHQLHIRATDGGHEMIALEPKAVAVFYREVMDRLEEMGYPVEIWPMPVEVEAPVRFDADTEHHAYDAEYAHRFFRALVQMERVFTEFRARFLGKVSPVNFYWGSFDVALTRFSGRRAPDHPGVPVVADFVTREAYSHEVCSAGFWPGAGLGEAAFYTYAYPEPDGFRDAEVEPPEAYYLGELGEFVLPYEAVRTAGDPDAALLGFLQSTYDAAAELGRWERGELER